MNYPSLQEFQENSFLLVNFLVTVTILYSVYYKLVLNRRLEAQALTPFYPNEVTTQATCCSHETALVGEVSGLGDYQMIHLPTDIKGRVEYCHQCLEDYITPCAWCGLAIFPYGKITLYSVDADCRTNLRTGAALLRYRGNLVAVGCARPGCATQPSDLLATWYPPGAVKFPYLDDRLPVFYVKAILILEQETAIASLNSKGL